MTVLPDLFVGVWVRESIALDGGPAAETEDVVWLQGPETFADVRLARAAGAPVTEAFGGTTGWDGKALRWAHELDWHGGFAQTDLGRIEWVDDVMVERGTMAVAGSDGERYEVAYEEIWRRESTDGPVLALGAATAAGTALHLAVDDWAITLAAGPPGTFALRLVRPGRATVERSEGDLRVPDTEDPVWCWTTRDDASHVGPAVETVSKHAVRRLPT